MTYKLVFFIFFTFTLFGQITKKQLDDVPSVAELVQPEPILLSIGKKTFTVKEFNQIYKRNVLTDTLPEKTPKQFLDYFIQKQLFVAKAEKEGLDTTMAFREEITTIKRELTASFMVEKSVNDALMKEAYSRLETEVNVAHILLDLSEFASPDDTLMAYNKLYELRSRILNGEKFNELALKNSADGTVKKDEGNLGYITAFQTLYPFESACYNTPVGKISLPFRTNHGYHIVKVLAKREYQRWKASHIFVAIKPNSIESDEATAKKKIDGLYERLLKLENFENLARLYSEDQTTNTKGGVFRRLFGTDELEKSFEDALFSLKKNGTFSEPIRTSKGWHIVRLIEKQELKPFSEMYNYLQNKVLSDSRFELSKKALLQRIKKENQFKVYQSVIDESKDLIDSLLSNKIDVDTQQFDLSLKPIFTIGQKDILAKKFIEFAQQKYVKSKKIYHEIYPSLWYDEFEMIENMDYEEAALEKKNLEFGNLISEYREGILIQNIEENYLKTSILEDTTAQRNYFIKNVEKYTLPERINLEIFDASNADNLKKAKDIFSKEPFIISLKWNDLLFSKNQSEVSENHQLHLKDLAILLLKNQSYQIEISGNIDPDETEVVSSERVQKVIKYLATLGIPVERIIEKDNGKFQPISKTERDKNMRVSFKLFSFNKQDVVKFQNALKPESLKVISGYFKKGENKTVDLLKWQLGEQQMEKSGRFIFANVLNIEPARKMNFYEAKGRVIKAMQVAKENEMIEKLKEIFPVIINDDLLKKISK